jgi:hypothetical protein
LLIWWKWMGIVVSYPIQFPLEFHRRTTTSSQAHERMYGNSCLQWYHKFVQKLWAICAYPSQFWLKTLEYVDKHSWKMYSKSCYNSIADLLKTYDYLKFHWNFPKILSQIHKKFYGKTHCQSYSRYIKNTQVLLLQIQFKFLLEVFRDAVKKIRKNVW